MPKKQNRLIIAIFITVLAVLSGILTFALYRNQFDNLTNDSKQVVTVNQNSSEAANKLQPKIDPKLPWLLTSMSSEVPSTNDAKLTVLESLTKNTTIRDQTGQKITNSNLKDVKDIGIFQNQAVIQNNDDSVTIWNLTDDSAQKISRQELIPKDNKIDQKYLFFRNFKLSSAKLYYEVLEDFAIVADLSTPDNPSDYDPCQNKQCSISEYDLSTKSSRQILQNSSYWRYDGQYHPSLSAVEQNQIITQAPSDGEYRFVNNFQFTDITTLKPSKLIRIVGTGNNDTLISLNVDDVDLDNLAQSTTPYKCINVESDKISPKSTQELQQCRQELIVKIGAIDTLNSDIKKYIAADINRNIASTDLITQLRLEYPDIAMGFNSPDLSKELVCGDYQTGINLPNSKNDGMIYISYKGNILPEYLMGSGDVKCLGLEK